MLMISTSITMLELISCKASVILGMTILLTAHHIHHLSPAGTHLLSRALWLCSTTTRRRDSVWTSVVVWEFASQTVTVRKTQTGKISMTAWPAGAQWNVYGLKWFLSRNFPLGTITELWGPTYYCQCRMLFVRKLSYGVYGLSTLLNNCMLIIYRGEKVLQ